MIPKHDKTLERKDIKIITTNEGNSLIYQDFFEVPVKFIFMDDSSNELAEIEFDEITPEETEICCFDRDLEDYYFAKVAWTTILEYSPLSEEDKDEEEKLNAQYLKELNSLSRYINYTFLNTGLILNNIMVV